MTSIEMATAPPPPDPPPPHGLAAFADRRQRHRRDRRIRGDFSSWSGRTSRLRHLLHHKTPADMWHHPPSQPASAVSAATDHRRSQAISLVRPFPLKLVDLPGKNKRFTTVPDKPELSLESADQALISLKNHTAKCRLADAAVWTRRHPGKNENQSHHEKKRLGRSGQARVPGNFPWGHRATPEQLINPLVADILVK